MFANDSDRDHLSSPDGGEKRGDTGHLDLRQQQGRVQRFGPQTSLAGDQPDVQFQTGVPQRFQAGDTSGLNAGIPIGVGQAGPIPAKRGTALVGGEQHDVATQRRCP
ncbi:MAG: hypothetical protein QOD93_3670 [Acetobacteraceae bacterium]|nr:hypothetical protein [Rhodopila sp.]MEA2770708.1 hypothetical protein [Acetobacteraceae bacterium]